MSVLQGLQGVEAGLWGEGFTDWWFRDLGCLPSHGSLKGLKLHFEKVQANTEHQSPTRRVIVCKIARDLVGP